MTDTTRSTESDSATEPSRLAAERAAGGDIVTVSLTVNGTDHTVDVEARRTLSDLIRDDLGLTGTHLGCEHGVCGACTVMLDGQPARSCLMLAAQADGADITTIEGLAGPDGELHPIQQAMVQSHGFQCAFCAPGFLISAIALIEDNPSPSRDEIREELSGNLCRCTGYQSIVDGVETAVGLMNRTNQRDEIAEEASS